MNFFVIGVISVAFIPNSSIAQTRLGLHYTQEELNIWRMRARNSPYKDAGDAGENSPGDYKRILLNANAFLSNPSMDRFIGYTGVGCVPQSTVYEPNNSGRNIKDAAFIYLITGESKYAAAVRDELLAQAEEPSTDFSNASKWCPNYINDLPPGYATASWLTRLLFSYDYIKSSLSSAEKNILNTWFLNAAKYFQSQVDPPLEGLYVNRYQNNYTLTDYGIRTSGLTTSISHYGGYKISSIAKYYNNRRGDMVRFYAMVGIMQGNASLQISAKLYVKEWLKYSTYPNGIIGEFERWATDLPDKGLSYAAAVVSQAIEIADAFARNGDGELYKYTTSEGLYGTAGGSKNILLTIKNILNYFDGKVTRYGTKDPLKAGNIAYLIDGKNDASGWYAAFDTYMSKANVYYKDAYVRNAYTRKGSGTSAYPARPAGAGPFNCWNGPGGIYPGILLMFGQMEGKVWPYPSVTPLNSWNANKLPTIDIVAPANNSTVIIGSDIEILTNTADTDGTIDKVEFYNGSTKIGEDLTAPFSFTWQNVVAGNFTINAKVIDDQGGETLDTPVAISVSGTCSATGTLLRDYWSNLGGADISVVPVKQKPTDSHILTTFEAPEDFGENFASRIRGYVCAPATGNYTFWISSNGASELWVSLDEDPAHKAKIAYVSSETKSREWTKYTTQQSKTISLIAGQKCYVEVLHKETSGSDHLAVGWSLPDGTLERPIGSNRISLFDPAANTILPSVATTFPVNNTSYIIGANVRINVDATDLDGSIEKVEFYQGSTKLGEDYSYPYSLIWNNTPEGDYIITAKAFDNSGAISTSSKITILVNSSCSATGTIEREYWAKIPGKAIADIPTNAQPNTITQLTIFEAPTNVGDSYGSRIRGYVCPPVTGNYTFWLSSDGIGELWLSTDNKPVNKRKIAYVEGFSYSRQYDKYPSQQSVPIRLVAGQRYYIETLHNETGGGDNVSVGWTSPDGTLERPLPGKRLSPYVFGAPSISITSPSNNSTFTIGTAIKLEVDASDENGVIQKVEFYDGESKIGESTKVPYTFTWSSSKVGNHLITAKAIDNTGLSSISSVAQITLAAITTCESTGSITREYWANVTGRSVNDIPITSLNNGVSQLSLFETPSNTGDNYGSRIRGYICPPVSGQYTFWIAGDDNCALWLSTDEIPANKVKIAYVDHPEAKYGYTGFREWNKYSTQQSGLISLQAGQRYYIEALHKEGQGNDYVSVGWQLPSAAFERPILGNRLIPFEAQNARLNTDAKEEGSLFMTSELNAYPNPFTNNITIEFNLTETSNAVLEIYDVKGALVKRIHSGKAESHTLYKYEFTTNAQHKAGLYLLRLNTGQKVLSKKVLLER